MALLKVTAEFRFDSLKILLRQFPDLNARFLALIGKRARMILKNEYLSGQELRLSAFPTDKKGRYTVTSSVNKKRTATTVGSYPVNLFERGRRLRSGGRESGKYIITKKLKQAVAARVAGYGREFENKILNTELKRMGFS